MPSYILQEPDNAGDFCGEERFVKGDIPFNFEAGDILTCWVSDTNLTFAKLFSLLVAISSVLTRYRLEVLRMACFCHRYSSTLELGFDPLQLSSSYD